MFDSVCVSFSAEAELEFFSQVLWPTFRLQTYDTGNEKVSETSA